MDQILTENEFEVRRVAAQYKQMLGNEFETELLSLPAESHYLDAGAGEANAIRDYVQREVNPIKSKKITAVGHTLPAKAVTHIEGVDYRYLSGRYLEEIPAKEMGPVDLISDLYGPFTYSSAPDVVLRKYLEVLKPGHSAYLYFNPTRTTVNESATGLGEFLKAIEGAEVRWVKTQYDGNNAVIKLTKHSDTVRVPTLKLEKFTPGDGTNPARGAAPERRYSW